MVGGKHDAYAYKLSHAHVHFFFFNVCALRRLKDSEGVCLQCDNIYHKLINAKHKPQEARRFPSYRE